MTDGDITLPALTLDTLFSVPDDAYVGGTMTMLGLTLSGAAFQGNDGAVSVPLLTLSADGFLSSAYDGALSLPELTLAGSLEPELPLPQLALAASGLAGTVATATLILPRLSLDGSLEAALQLPLFTLDAAGHAGTLADAEITMPALEVKGALDAALALPALELSAAYENGAIASAMVTLPYFALDAGMTQAGDATMPALSLDADGVTGQVGVGNLALPKPTLSGTYWQDGDADGDATLPLMTLSGSIIASSVISGNAVLGSFALAASGATGNLMTAEITIPMLTLGADGYFDAAGSATITLPLFLLNGSMHSVAVTAPAFTSLTLNTRNKAVTTYTNSGFNSYASFAGMTLAASSTGIVALTGDTDDGNAIAAYLLSGVSDFDSETNKRVLAGYVGYRAGGVMDLTLITDQHHEYIYRLEPRQDAADLHTARVKTGRGVDGRYWQWKLANRAGAAFEISSVTLEAEILKRRV